jgi:indole-3-glycerol phosphate synthase
MSSPPPSVLGQILRRTRVELERRKRELPERVLEGHMLEGRSDRHGHGHGDAGGRGRLRRALTRPGIAVIAEFKRRSPSAGALRQGADVNAVVRAYERGGAVAVSVLTDGPSFAGSLEDLRLARRACRLPILRKDFIIDPYQLHEARAAGADAVLLIVAALHDDEIASLQLAARELGLDVLVEVHDQAELGRALQAGAELIGINNRDLRDFSVDVQRTSQLIGEVPAGTTVVSESGITSAGQLRTLEQQGVDAVLVGESLMRAPDPEAELLALRAPAATGASAATSGRAAAGTPARRPAPSDS